MTIIDLFSLSPTESYRKYSLTLNASRSGPRKLKKYEPPTKVRRDYAQSTQPWKTVSNLARSRAAEQELLVQRVRRAVPLYATARRVYRVS